MRRALAGGTGRGGEAGCGGGAADERGGTAAGAGGEADAAGHQGQDGLLRRAPQQARQAQALSGAGVARWGWQESAPGLLRHRRGGGAVRRALAGGTGRGGEAGCVAPPLTTSALIR